MSRVGPLSCWWSLVDSRVAVVTDLSQWPGTVRSVNSAVHDDSVVDIQIISPRWLAVWSPRLIINTD